jgi:YidC/Oxa1 family membrane protein insertase
MILDILYTIIIYPLTQIIEFVFVVSDKIFKETGMAVLGVSAAISILCLPLYMVADHWQQIERNIQKRLKPKIDTIKSVFKGDEQYMILSAYYRQNKYHPMYALRGSFGLLVQIPFFIAAYSYLSHLEALKGAHFLFISDLGAPDNLAHIGALRINILPIAMTLINSIAGAVYLKGFPAKDKIQIYGMALIFLILLYNSPSGLVLYWTMNNVFSLFKNCMQKTKHPHRILFFISCILIAALDFYLLVFHRGFFGKRLFFAAVCSVVFFSPLLIKLLKKINWQTALPGVILGKTRVLICAVFILFLLTGLVIPSALIASSVEEFSFIDTYASPFPFIAAALLQSAGIFFGISLITFLFSKRVRIILTAILSVLGITALINAFVFPGNYGFLTTTMQFSDASAFNDQLKNGIYNILILIAVLILFFITLHSKWKNSIYSIQIIIIIALSTFGAYNSVKIYREFNDLKTRRAAGISGDEMTPVYRFSLNGKNSIIIMLDRSIPGYVPYIFQEKPELNESFSDFTWYPNCVSLGGYTLLGFPPLMGGYEYAPMEIQKQDTKLLVKKYNESLLVLPRLFSEHGFDVTVTDPSWANFRLIADTHIYDEYPHIHAENLNGRYTAHWLRGHPDIHTISFSALLKNNLIHFSFFKIAPVFFRSFLYNNGDWLVRTEFSAAQF